MEEVGERTLVSARFPAPPVYYKYYGDDTEQCHETAVSKDPPKPPQVDYQVFGEPWSVKQPVVTLKAQGVKELFDSSAPPQQEIRRLVKHLLRSFVEMLNSIGLANVKKKHEEPASSQRTAVELAGTIDLCFKNVLYLVNQFRENQARQKVIDTLKVQIQFKKDCRRRLEELEQTTRRGVQQITESYGHLSESQLIPTNR